MSFQCKQTSYLRELIISLSCFSLLLLKYFLPIVAIKTESIKPNQYR